MWCPKIHSRSTQDPLKIHSRSTEDPLKIHWRSNQDPFKIQSRSIQNAPKIHGRPSQGPASQYQIQINQRSNEDPVKLQSRSIRDPRNAPCALDTKHWTCTQLRVYTPCDIYSQTTGTTTHWGNYKSRTHWRRTRNSTAEHWRRTGNPVVGNVTSST